MDIKFETSSGDKGYFNLYDNDKKIGELEVGINDDVLTANHTEIFEGVEGTGLGKKLFNALVDHARKNNLKIVPLCTYVKHQFNRHNTEFADILSGDA